MYKKTPYLFLLQFLILLLLVIINQPAARAVDISTGAAVWYAKWEPTFLKEIKSTDSIFETKNVKMDPNFMLGPVLSVKLTPEISLSGVFLWGSWYNIKSDSVNLSPNNYKTGNENIEIKKYDLDTAFNYAFNDTIKFFAGIKYQGYNYTINGNEIEELRNYPYSFKFKTKSTGPGAGIGITYPLGGNFYLLANISGIYMYNTTKIPQTVGENIQTILTQHYDILGWNSSVAFSYYMVPWNTTFSLGGRCQYLHYENRGTYPYNPLEPGDTDSFHHKADRFYGLTFSCTYNFKL